MPNLGDFCVIGHGSSLTAMTIETFTGSPYYHAAIFVGNGDVIEARPEGVGAAPIGSWTNRTILWSNLDLTDEQRKNICESARAMAGIPYSWVDIVALGLSAWGITPEWVWKRLERSDRLICSQLVARCYHLAGINLIPSKADCRITPGDLADVIEHKPVPPNR